MNESVLPPEEPEYDKETVEQGALDVAQTTPPTAQAPLIISQESTAWDRATKRTAVIVLLVLGASLFWMSRPVLPVLILAFMISYLLSPIVDLLERVRVPRGLSTVVLYLLLLMVIVLAPVLLIPVLIDQLTALIVRDVPRSTVDVVAVVQNWINELDTQFVILGFPVNFEGLISQIQETINGELAFQMLPTTRDLIEYFNQLIITTTNVVGGTALLGLTLVGGIFNIFLFLLFLFFISLYMTKDAPRIRNYIEGLFPESYHSEAAELLRMMGQIWQSFFRGQLILSIVIGVVTWGILSLLGMPGALILGIIAGALEVIPNIGPVLAMIPAVVVALIQGSTVLEIGNLQFALLTVGVYFVIQQLENQLLVPRIIGTSVNLHPIVVLCGVVVGASVGGILGAFLAAPIIASLRVVGSYVHAKLLDYPPFLNRPRTGTVQRQPYVYRRVVIPEAEEEDAEEEPKSAAARSQTSGEWGSTAAR